MILFLSYEDNILSMFNHQRDPLCRPTREILYGIYNRYKPARDPLGRARQVITRHGLCPSDVSSSNDLSWPNRPLFSFLVII